MLRKMLEFSQEKLVEASINSVSSLSSNEYLFSLYKNKQHYNFLLCINNNASYFTILDEKFERFPKEGSFVSLLNNHISNCKIISINQINSDRILDFYLRKLDELGEIKEYHLIAELTGKLTNLILTNKDYQIINAVNKYLGESSRSIATGVIYEAPTLISLKDPFKDSYDKSLPLKDQFSSMSSNLVTEINYRLQNNEKFEDIIKEIQDSNKLYVYKNDYYVIEFKHLDEEYNIGDIFPSLRLFYLNKKESKPTITNDLIKIVNKQIKHLSSKIIKLKKELDNSTDANKYQEYADGIFTYYSSNLNEKKSKIKINEEEIKLDDKLSLKDNALKFYKKSQKLRSSGPIIEEQINISSSLISYYESLVYNLSVATPIEIEEIKEELIEERLLKGSKNNKAYKKKVNFLEYNVDGIKITVGRNNKQNDYITHKLAKYNEYFFHVKDYPGSHVIVHTDILTENIIRKAANIASIYSAASSSSSVPVDYCLVKNVKRHPSGKLGQVLLKDYKTIYIDPNKKLI